MKLLKTGLLYLTIAGAAAGIGLVPGNTIAKEYNPTRSVQEIFEGIPYGEDDIDTTKRPKLRETVYNCLKEIDSARGYSTSQNGFRITVHSAKDDETGSEGLRLILENRRTERKIYFLDLNDHDVQFLDLKDKKHSDLKAPFRLGNLDEIDSEGILLPREEFSKYESVVDKILESIKPELETLLQEKKSESNKALKDLLEAFN